MLNRFRSLRVLFALIAVLGVVAACSSSGGGDDDRVEDEEHEDLSEDEAEDRIGAVLDAFEKAAAADGFDLDDDADDDDDSKLECEGFEAFTSDDDAIAEDELSVTDGNHASNEVVGDELIFSGGAVKASVDVGVLSGDRLERALDSVRDDPDSFGDCLKESIEATEIPTLPGADVEMDVTLEEGDAGDQEIIVTLDGTVSGVTEGLDYVFEITGYARYVRVGSAGLVVTVESTGIDVDTTTVGPAVDAAIAEFENQFG